MGAGQRAKQVESSLRPRSHCSAVQAAPLSEVVAINGRIPEGLSLGPNPTATHETVVEQETASSPVTAAGTGLEIQICPPSLVERMS
jgi:hypothetical protein